MEYYQHNCSAPVRQIAGYPMDRCVPFEYEGYSLYAGCAQGETFVLKYFGLNCSGLTFSIEAASTTQCLPYLSRGTVVQGFAPHCQSKVPSVNVSFAVEQSETAFSAMFGCDPTVKSCTFFDGTPSAPDGWTGVVGYVSDALTWPRLVVAAAQDGECTKDTESGWFKMTHVGLGVQYSSFTDAQCTVPSGSPGIFASCSTRTFMSVGGGLSVFVQGFGPACSGSVSVPVMALGVVLIVTLFLLLGFYWFWMRKKERQDFASQEEEEQEVIRKLLASEDHGGHADEPVPL
jgi:hypothetical protein